MSFRLLRVSVASACLGVWAADVSAKTYRLTLAPAAVDRAGQVVEFALPADAPKRAEVRRAEGTKHAVQVGADGKARFVVPWQKAGETIVFTVDSAAGAPAEQVKVTAEPQRLQVTVAGQPAFDYQLDRDRVPRPDIKPEIKRAGYIHPVFSPTGKIVTDDYPSNHVHHHGIWAPWTKTQFQGRSPDFWNMHHKTGAEHLVGVDRTWSGAVHGGFAARLEMIDLSAPTPVVALRSSWRVTAYDLPPVNGQAARVFDLEITQTCATEDPLMLPKYHYGGFGFRGAAGWNGRGDAALFLTSEGITDRIAGNDSRARWCWLGGRIEGDVTGTAVLGHPGNFRAPQPVRLHPNMPYFSFVPQQLGEFAIEPGKPYVMRFRFVVADGAPDRARLDAFWNGYAVPAAVKLEAL